MLIRTLSALLMGLLLGYGAATLLTEGDGAVTRSDPSQSLDRAAQSAVSKAVTEEGASSPPSAFVEMPPQTKIQGIEGFRAEILRMMKQLPRSVAERGPGTIEGFLRTPSGETLSNVTLELAAIESPTFLDANDEVGIFLTRVLSERWLRAHRWTTTTDAEGRFRFDNLPMVSYELESKDLSWAVVPRDHNGETLRPNSDSEWIGVQRVPVEVRVLDPQGAPATNAVLEFRRVDQGHEESLALDSLEWQSAEIGGAFDRPYSSESDFSLDWSPATPTAWLPPASYRVRARREPAADRRERSEVVTTRVLAENEPGALTLKLRPAVSLRVELLPEGSPPDNRHYGVALLRLRSDQPIDAIAAHSVSFNHFIRGASGAAHFGDLSPGDYALLARSEEDLHPLFGEEESPQILRERIAVGAEPMTYRLRIAPPDLTQCFEVHTFDENNRPIEELNLDVVAMGSDGEPVPLMSSVIARNGGVSWIRLKQGPRSPEVRQIKVLANHQWLGDGEAQSAWPVRGPMRLQWTQRASVLLHLPGASALPAGAIVVCEVVDAKGRSHPVGPLSNPAPGDQWELTDLAIGEATVFLRFPGPEVHSSQWEIGRFQVNRGRSAASVPISSSSSLSIEAGSEVDLPRMLRIVKTERSRGEPFTIHVLRHGPKAEVQPQSVDIPLMPAGHYRLMGEDGSAIQETQVSGHTKIRWQPMPMNALRVQIHSATGRLAKAGFEQDDLIVAIDGQEIAGKAPYAMMGLLAPSNTPKKVRVLRAGRSLELELLLSEDDEGWSGFGGDFQPAVR